MHACIQHRTFTMFDRKQATMCICTQDLETTGFDYTSKIKKKITYCKVNQLPKKQKNFHIII